MITICQFPIEKLTPNDRNTRTHTRKQIQEIANSISAFGFVNPILIDEDAVIIAGHGRYAAAKLLGLKQVPAIELRGLSKAKRRALAIADNKIAENAGWNRELLAVELPELAQVLIEENIDISITGYAPVEIDQLATDFERQSSDPADGIDPKCIMSNTVTKPGDLWQLGNHRLLCADARKPENLNCLMDGSSAAMAFLDPPYNVRVRDIVPWQRQARRVRNGLGRTVARGVRRCMDWRHTEELLKAGNSVYGDILNIAVWVKSNAGQGSFYRSQHEFIGVFRVGEAPHLNNIELGRHGRSRSNVWHHAGVNTFRAGRMEDLQSHPTVKPVALVSEAMKDCTRRGDVVLDTFCGSGTTILAAERVGRRAYIASDRCFDEMEADPDAAEQLLQAA